MAVAAGEGGRAKRRTATHAHPGRRAGQIQRRAAVERQRSIARPTETEETTPRRRRETLGVDRHESATPIRIERSGDGELPVRSNHGTRRDRDGAIADRLLAESS